MTKDSDLVFDKLEVIEKLMETNHYLVIASFKINLANSWTQKKLNSRTRLDIERTKGNERIKTYQGKLNDLLTKTSQNSEQSLEET